MKTLLLLLAVVALAGCAGSVTLKQPLICLPTQGLLVCQHPHQWQEREAVEQEPKGLEL